MQEPQSSSRRAQRHTPMFPAPWLSPGSTEAGGSQDRLLLNSAHSMVAVLPAWIDCPGAGGRAARITPHGTKLGEERVARFLTGAEGLAEVGLWEPNAPPVTPAAGLSLAL